MKKTWCLDEFDSNIFGLKVAKVNTAIFSDQDLSLSRSVIETMLKEFNENKVEYATLRLAQANYPLIHALEDVGFRLVDEMIDFEVSIDTSSCSVDPHVRKAIISDITELKMIARESWQITRFFNDSFLSTEKAKLLYELWIENSLRGKMADAVFVWQEETNICGYITLKKDGHIPLVAVLPDHQGRGISRKMVKAVFNECKNLGIVKSYIETQVANISAIRSYQSCGFKPISSSLTLRWRLNH
jgi:dTDP-4-amino-4,6-dideoxy-D-galactose acyltransferase